MTQQPRFDGLPPDRGSPADMTEWARLLDDIVRRRLYPTGEVDLLAPSWDGMFDDALAEVMRAMIAARVAALTAEQFVTAYRAVGGDAALLSAMSSVAAERARCAERDLRVLRMTREAAVAGRLSLTELDAGETLEIGLFDPSQPALAAWRFRDNAEKRPRQRVLRVRVVEPGAGRVEAITDTWTGAVWAEKWRTPSCPTLTRAQLGSRDADIVVAELTLHAPLVLALDDGVELTPPQIVGYVRTLDGTLLLDGT